MRKTGQRVRTERAQPSAFQGNLSYLTVRGTTTCSPTSGPMIPEGPQWTGIDENSEAWGKSLRCGHITEAGRARSLVDHTIENRITEAKDVAQSLLCGFPRRRSTFVAWSGTTHPPLKDETRPQARRPVTRFCWRPAANACRVGISKAEDRELRRYIRTSFGHPQRTVLLNGTQMPKANTIKTVADQSRREQICRISAVLFRKKSLRTTGRHRDILPVGRQSASLYYISGGQKNDILRRC